MAAPAHHFSCPLIGANSEEKKKHKKKENRGANTSWRFSIATIVVPIEPFILFFAVNRLNRVTCIYRAPTEIKVKDQKVEMQDDDISSIDAVCFQECWTKKKKYTQGGCWCKCYPKTARLRTIDWLFHNNSKYAKGFFFAFQKHKRRKKKNFGYPISYQSSPTVTKIPTFMKRVTIPSPGEWCVRFFPRKSCRIVYIRPWLKRLPS